MHKTTTATMALIGAAAIGAVTQVSSAALNPSDPSIINLYRLNEQAPGGPFNNAVSGQFLDTAVTGTPQNHEDVASAPSPTWVSTGAVGDGVGLSFSRAASQHTRFEPWMHLTQGNYSPGDSFTVMVRLNAAALADNTTYDLLGTGSNQIRLEGSGSAPNSAAVRVQLRDPDTFWFVDSFGNTSAGSSSSGASFVVTAGTWANVFLIYEAGASLKVAMDNGTSFAAQTTTGVPATFDPIAQGFDNASSARWFVGSTGSPTTTSYDGVIESIVIWDKALTNAEADAIDFTTVPEPAAVSLLGLGALALRRRK